MMVNPILDVMKWSIFMNENQVSIDKTAESKRDLFKFAIFLLVLNLTIILIAVLADPIFEYAVPAILGMK